MKKSKQKSSSKNSSEIVRKTYNKPTFDLRPLRRVDKKTRARLLAKLRRVLNNATPEELEKAATQRRRRRRK